MTELKLFMLLLTWCIIQVFGDSAVKNITISKSTTIKSPNYPNNYPPNTTVTWLLRDSDGVGTWELLFTGDIKLEQSKTCAKDYLEITEKKDPKRLCGHIQGLPSIISKTPELKIKFKSDGTIQDKGFEIRVIHIIDKDGRKRLKEMGDGLEGRKANVINEDEQGTPQNPVFFALVSILAVAVLVFVILLICLVIGVYNKRKQRYRTNPKSVIKHIQFAVTAPPPASNPQMPRRYSRPSSLMERQDTNSHPIAHKSSTSSRGPLLSSGSIRYS